MRKRGVPERGELVDAVRAGAVLLCLSLYAPAAVAEETVFEFRFEDRMYPTQPEASRCLPDDHFINEARVTESFGLAIEIGQPEEEGPMIASATIDPQNCVTIRVSHVRARQVFGEGRGLFGGRATVTIRYEVLKEL